jgi:ectoine hydroxylase-related dioxygenase (phytanoyl-CoA dioxygenase family)
MKNYDQDIIEAKKILRNKSKNYKENFKKIEKFIETEVQEIQKLKNSNSIIIPEVDFKDLGKSDNSKIINDIKRRGCVVVRDVFDDKQIKEWNNDIEKYIEKNNYYERQKEKAGLDNYFSDLKSGKPQIFGIYWSKTQTKIRQSEELNHVKKWINNLWIYQYDGYQVFDPNKELIYADRVRRREAGDSTLGLSPHCDAGSIERWIESNYQKIYDKVFSDQFEKYDPFQARYREKTDLIQSPAVSNTFRTFQGWTALTKQGPSDGTLQLIPIAKSMAYVLTRALLDDVPENELCRSKPARALSANKEYHSLLLQGLVSIPAMNPGDTVWWHPDIIHAVEDNHTGQNYSNVVYVGSMPLCEKNLEYAKRQAQSFLKGESPPDFAAENYETNFTGRSTIEDLTELGLKQLALKGWN